MGMMIHRYKVNKRAEMPSKKPKIAEENVVTEETTTEAEKPIKKYNKREIMRASKDELLSLAKHFEVENYDSKNGNELKEILINIMGL